MVVSHLFRKKQKREEGACSLLILGSGIRGQVEIRMRLPEAVLASVSLQVALLADYTVDMHTKQRCLENPPPGEW